MNFRKRQNFRSLHETQVIDSRVDEFVRGYDQAGVIWFEEGHPVCLAGTVLHHLFKIPHVMEVLSMETADSRDYIILGYGWEGWDRDKELLPFLKNLFKFLWPRNKPASHPIWWPINDYQWPSPHYSFRKGVTIRNMIQNLISVAFAFGLLRLTSDGYRIYRPTPEQEDLIHRPGNINPALLTLEFGSFGSKNQSMKSESGAIQPHYTHQGQFPAQFQGSSSFLVDGFDAESQMVGNADEEGKSDLDEVERSHGDHHQQQQQMQQVQQQTEQSKINVNGNNIACDGDSQNDLLNIDHAQPEKISGDPTNSMLIVEGSDQHPENESNHGIDLENKPGSRKRTWGDDEANNFELDKEPTKQLTSTTPRMKPNIASSQTHLTTAAPFNPSGKPLPLKSFPKNKVSKNGPKSGGGVKALEINPSAIMNANSILNASANHFVTDDTFENNIAHHSGRDPSYGHYSQNNKYRDYHNSSKNYDNYPPRDRDKERYRDRDYGFEDGSNAAFPGFPRYPFMPPQYPPFDFRMPALLPPIFPPLPSFLYHPEGGNWGDQTMRDVEEREHLKKKIRTLEFENEDLEEKIGRFKRKLRLEKKKVEKLKAKIRKSKTKGIGAGEQAAGGGGGGGSLNKSNNAMHPINDNNSSNNNGSSAKKTTDIGNNVEEEGDLDEDDCSLSSSSTSSSSAS